MNTCLVISFIYVPRTDPKRPKLVNFIEWLSIRNEKNWIEAGLTFSLTPLPIQANLDNIVAKSLPIMLIRLVAS